MTAVGWLLLAAALLITVPSAILLIECLAAVGMREPPTPGAGGVKRPRLAVLLPAHNEELGIAGTVGSVLPQLDAGDRLIVVADNCSDATAALARKAGAQVIERQDAERRGKGFALQFGLEHLDADPPEVVVLIDADCRISDHGIGTIAALAARTGRPVQAEYLLTPAAGADPMNVVSGLAVLVRNRIRPRGMLALGLPCQLTGSGMAFPWLVLRHAPETGSNLVEDLVMGLEMALRGSPALLCPAVQVTSELPAGQQAAMKQRRRWEHGQLHTLTTYGPRLIGKGLLGRASLLGLGLDLVVPPLAMLVMLEGAALLALGGAAALGLVSWLPALVVGAGLGAVGLAVVLGWARFGRAIIPLRGLLLAPLYVLWKVPLYISLLVGRRQKTWERTERGGGGSPPAP
jgi:hypothetical protein